MVDETSQPPKRKRGRPTKPVAEMLTEDAKKAVKHGGKRDGAGSKRQFNRIDVYEKLVALNFDPLVELVKIAGAPDCDVRLKANICQDLLGYCAPKLKATELKVDDKSGLLGGLLEGLANAGRPKPPSES